MKKTLLLLLLGLGIMNVKLTAQNIFPEKFEGCNTDRFSAESEKIEVEPTNKDIIYVLANNFSSDNIKKIRGELHLQIIVDVNGKSCLLSVENKTNIESDKLELKNIIDNILTWRKPNEKTSVMIAMMFYENEVAVKRIGMNREKGFHEITN